jgi:hypothetical protein
MTLDKQRAADPVQEARQALEAAVERAARRGHDADRLAGLNTAIRRAERDADARGQTARIEGDDVRAIESFSFTKLWALLRGELDVERARERGEHEVAEWQLAEARARLDGLRAEAAEIGDRLDNSPRGADDVNVARLGLAQALADAGRTERNDLDTLIERRTASVTRLDELREAIAAGEAAATELRAAKVALGAAGSWSTYDTWFGGGFIASAIKHDRMDTAGGHARKAQQLIERFQVELADVEQQIPDLDLPASSRFWDTWMDNVFVDLFVGSQIAEASDAVHRALVTAGRVVASCHEMSRRTVAEVDEIDRVIDELTA